MPISVIILITVLILIALRQVGNLRFQIWQVMAAGAIAVIAMGEISPASALRAINFDVMLFLFATFIIGRALEDSGYLAHLASRFLRRANTAGKLTVMVLFSMGLLSALLMNDTVAIVGTPIMLYLSRKHGINPQMLLLTLTFSVTLGSVISPIGNPQNLLIAIEANIGNPFQTFMAYLFVPTNVNLLIAFVMIRFYYSGEFTSKQLTLPPDPINDKKLAALARFSIMLMIIMILAKIIFSFSGQQTDFKLTYIALVSATPILLLSPRRFAIIRRIDWHTLAFFAAMFILMDSVWRTGFCRICPPALCLMGIR